MNLDTQQYWSSTNETLCNMYVYQFFYIYSIRLISIFDLGHLRVQCLITQV